MTSASLSARSKLFVETMSKSTCTTLASNTSHLVVVLPHQKLSALLHCEYLDILSQKRKTSRQSGSLQQPLHADMSDHNYMMSVKSSDLVRTAPYAS